jgi:hypothetical protein
MNRRIFESLILKQISSRMLPQSMLLKNPYARHHAISNGSSHPVQPWALRPICLNNPKLHQGARRIRSRRTLDSGAARKPVDFLEPPGEIALAPGFRLARRNGSKAAQLARMFIQAH